MSGIISDNQGRSTGLIKAAGGGGALTLITAATHSGSATIEISTLGSGYNNHKLVMTTCYGGATTAGYMYLYFSTGGSYITANEDSYAATESFSHENTRNTRKGEQVAFIQITPDGMREDIHHNTIIDFSNLLNAKTKAVNYADAGSNGDYDYRVRSMNGAGILNNTGVTDAFKLVDSQGSAMEGSYQLYGYAAS